ncbi:hypothetical protein CKA32_003145 [Geitlerinema sp. FC II]|nr:hypothetical protein CKA32_003145 [Geitlerinema sp. FC II]
MEVLTSEQAARIPEFQEKWKNVYLSTEPLDRDRAEASIKELYRLMKQPDPEIVFCQSPREVLNYLEITLSTEEREKSTSRSVNLDRKPNFLVLLFKALIGALYKKIRTKPKPIEKVLLQLSKATAKSFDRAVKKSFKEHPVTLEEGAEQVFLGENSLLVKTFESKAQKIGHPEDFPIDNFKNHQLDYSHLPKNRLNIYKLFWLWSIKKAMRDKIVYQVIGFQFPNMRDAILQSSPSLQVMLSKADREKTVFIGWQLCQQAIWLDFATSVLNYPSDVKKQAALQNFLEQCGWTITIDRTCLICDRPTTVRLDEEQLLHGDGEPALEFSDGFKAYAFHGIGLPEKYGSVPISQWESQWVLEENNRQLKKIITGQIGAVRLVRELPTVAIESRGEYSLVQLENGDSRDSKILKRSHAETGEISAEFVEWMTKSIDAALHQLHQRGLADEFPFPEANSI